MLHRKGLLLFTKCHLIRRLRGSGASDHSVGRRRTWRSLRAGRALMLLLPACSTLVGMGGCDAFNPAFVNLLDPTGSAQFATLDNAPGHVVIAFVNNAVVDERLLTLLLQTSPRLADSLSEAEKRALRPRMIVRVRITFRDGTSQLIEFIDGSGYLVDDAFDALSVTDLNLNDLNTVVVVCDVARVEVVDPVSVFVPVTWTVFAFVDPTGLNPGFFREARQEVPKFVPLRVDDVDDELNTLLRRNIGIRDAPVPIDPVRCGSVVAITLDGVLSVPFFDQGGGRPGFDIRDLETAASIGGRYEFNLVVR